MNGMQDPLGTAQSYRDNLDHAPGVADDVKYGLLLPLFVIGLIAVSGYLLISAFL